MEGTTYQTKILEVKANKITHDNYYKDIHTFAGDEGRGRFLPRRDGCLDVKTPRGLLRVTPGNYLVEGLRGEYYSCTPEEFYEQYTTRN